MAVTPETIDIVRDVHINASPATVFEYLVDPDKLVRWMGRSATLDPRPGGIFRVEYLTETGGRPIARGEFLVVERPSRLVVSWGWEDPDDPTPPGSTTVEFTLKPDGEGTRLTLRHSGLRSDAHKPHADGWDFFLGRLVETASAPSA